jgi:hypothetical protein
MTSLAFILGVAPLAFSTGAGAGARVSVGTGVMGGMLAATFLAIFFIPLFYRAIVDRRLKETRSTQDIEEEAEHHRTATQHSGPLPPHHTPHPSTGGADAP